MRPEELIAGVYRQITELKELGQVPSQVIMSLEHYRLLDWYRNFLGESSNRDLEYLGQYEIFGLEILIDSLAEPQVRC